MEICGLNNEEKKAIKGLEWSQQQMRLGNLPDYNQGHYADIRIVLNLIEKQSKEIEELKKYEEGYKLLSYSLNNYTSNDKIKAKIEEYEEILQSSIIKEDYKLEVQHIIGVLKELKGDN